MHRGDRRAAIDATDCRAASSPPKANVALSVIVPITKPWPDVASNVETVIASARRVEAEILAVDGDGRGVPTGLAPFVQRIDAPGADAFSMRAIGLVRARGAIVAITEDHCRVPVDWCEEILAAHARREECDAICGAVVNAEDKRMHHRAHFLLTSAHCLPPLAPEVCGPPPIANFSVKRRAIAEGAPRVGWLEEEFMPDLVLTGRVLNDDRIIAEHVQRLGLLRTFATHFHNGRATAGLASVGIPISRRAAWVRECLRLPRRTLSQVRRAARGKPAYRREIRAALPLIALLSVSASVGQVFGVLHGPGASPQRLNEQPMKTRSRDHRDTR